MRYGLLLVLILGLLACSSDPESPEAQIRAVFEKIELAAEASDRRGISEHISERYQDDHGMDKADANNVLRAYLLRNKNINIFLSFHSFAPISPQEYIVDLSAAMAAKGVNLENESERLKADVHRFTVTLVDESAGNGEWKVTRLERQ